ncbi:hypothetical protein AAVH_13611 [Aphelenchoides avenae]|nr:hypothetical protein AAVH_13611 [Aphelenchus avenae]
MNTTWQQFPSLEAIELRTGLFFAFTSPGQTPPLVEYIDERMLYLMPPKRTQTASLGVSRTALRRTNPPLIRSRAATANENKGASTAHSDD